MRWMHAAERSYQSAYLTSAHLISCELLRAAQWSDLARRGCDQSHKTAHTTSSFWLSTAMANRVASQYTQFGMDEMSYMCAAL